MSTKHGQDLTADLLHDLTAEQAVLPAPPEPPEPPAVARPTRDEPDAAASAVVETSLFLAPSRWLRPRIHRTDATLSVSAGPLRVRVRRR